MRQHRLNVILLGVLVLMLISLIAFYVWFFAFRGSDMTNGNESNTSNEVTENSVVTNNTTNVTNSTNTTNTTNSVANTRNTTVPSKGSSSTSGNITVTSPAVGTKVGKTFSVSGFAKVFENVVQVRIKDSKGVILLESFVNTNAPDVGKTGTFNKSLTLEKDPTTKKGTIEFFTSNEATGAEEDKVSVAVNF